MRKIIPVVVGGTTALAVAAGTFGFVTLNKDVTVSVDGAAKEVSTFSSTVGEVLKDQGVTVSDRDVVAPALDAKITDGTEIAVQYARQVKIAVDGQEKSYWTTATNVGQALLTLGINAQGAQLSTSRSSSVGREGMRFVVATLKTVTVDAAGKKQTVKTTGQTVAAALSAAKVKPDANDILSVKKDAKLTNGAKLTFTKVDTLTLTKKQIVDYKTIWQRSSTLDKGDTKVEAEGKKGERTLTYQEVRHNGLVKSTKKTSSKVTKDPTTRVMLVGTHIVEKQPTKTSSDSSSSPSSKSSSTSSTKSPSVASGSVWDQLANCESGGNWAINTGNGFYGGLQFTLQTWRGYGGSGMPNQASREAQIAVAKKVQAGQGWGAWPACTSKLGIR